MNVLITGVTGFAAAHLTAFCAGQGCSITGLGRRDASEADLPPELSSYEVVDLSDGTRTRQAVRAASPELVFHLAADSSVAESWKNPVGVIDNNVMSTLNVLEAVRHEASGARVLVACSGEEYGEPESLPVTERHPLRPRSPYALSKASVDLVAGFYADAYGTHAIRTRAFNHVGPGQSDTYVVSSFARQIAEAESAGNANVEIVTGNLDVRRDFTDVRDVVRAYWLALERAEPSAYNVCSGQSSVIADILAALAHESALEVTPRTDAALLREHEVMEIRGSHEKLTSATGWHPEIPLERTLRDTLDWWRERVGAGVTR